jgi:hypothetical protein
MSAPSSSLSVIDSNSPNKANKKRGVGATSENETSASTAASATATSQNIPSSSSSLDFVGSSHAVKDLFSLPYVVDRPISVAVHNLGGTLVLDADPDQEMAHHYPTTAPSSNAASVDDESSSKKQHTKVENLTRSLVALSSMEPTSEALTIVNSLIESSRRSNSNQGTADTTSTTPSSSSQLAPPQVKMTGSQPLGLPRPDDYVARFIPPVPEPREYLSWKFHNMDLLVGSNAVIYRSPETSTALAVRVEEASDLKSLSQVHQEMVCSGNFVPDHQFAKLQQMGKPSYAEAARKKMQQIEQEKDEKINVQKEKKSDTGKSFAAPDLDKVRLQTCIVPASNSPLGGLLSSGRGVVRYENGTSSSGQMERSPSPVSTVLDAYLDNIMANVPQLALCLQDKGFVQSVKLLNTDQIPSFLLHPSTLDTTKAFEIMEGGNSAEQVFSPEIMEMNASTLLRFLKTQCTKDNATYLLRREVGHTNIQLYDISSISAQRQQKWNWWLAMMSNRFANRLRSLAANTTDRALRRSFRARQRSLLQNTLELLEALADMNGKSHESLIAAINENLADTFLTHEDDDDANHDGAERPNQPAPATSVSSQQPYSSITVDALNKAQDHLVEGIRVLWPTLKRVLQRMERALQKRQSPAVSLPSQIPVKSIGTDHESSESSDEDSSGSDIDEEECRMEIIPVATQLFGLHHKLVSVSLRLAEIHLRNYYSSSAMQSLRTAARRIADSLYLTQLVASKEEKRHTEEWVLRLQLQYTWLWEHCGHFARSFAADELWRERGHASGEDVVSVLQDVDCALREGRLLDSTDLPVSCFVNPRDSLSDKSMGLISLRSLSGVVGFRSSVEKGGEPSWFDDERVEIAESLLGKQRLLQREQRRVLVAACIAYGRSIDSYRRVWTAAEDDDDPNNAAFLGLLRQRLGDACNETGKAMMNEVRSLLAALPAEKDGSGDDGVALAADPLLCSAEFWFLEGLGVFQDCKDLRNLALLRCNLCQCWKLRANSVFADEDSKLVDNPSHAEVCLQEAANHLQAAHEVLGQRDTDPTTWDMVSAELAATFLVLGVRRRQSLVGSGNMPVILQALRLSPGKERSIVEPMERALEIYQLSSNHHQAAAAHYQLALFYSKIWTCQRDEAKTREKLASAFHHYNASHAFFSQAIRGNEPTFCLLCLDLSNLYSTVSGEECLTKALRACFDTAAAFSRNAIDTATRDVPSSTRSQWLEKMATLAGSVEERAFKIIRNLVKLEETGEKKGKSFKEIYRVGLCAKMTASNEATDDPLVQRLIVVHDILQAISEQF